MDWIEVIAVGAGLGSVASFVPQLVRVIKAPEPEGVSPTMYAISVCTFLLWTTYGVFTAVWPLVVANAACLLLTLAILATTLLRQRSAQQPRDELERPATAVSTRT